MPGKMAVERAVSEMLPAGEWPGGERSASASVRGAKVQKHASLPLDLTARDAPASAAFVRAASRVGSAGTALSGAPSASAAALSEDQALAMEAKAAAMQLKYESKADCLNTGLVHPDWKMRKAAAIELPLHCERRPVETFVVREYLRLLQDPVMDVRQTTLEHLPDLVERGDRSAIRAVLHRMWGDVSWAVRLASIHCIEKIAHVGDEQAILGVVARITDPEAARGGTFWVRAAAREAALRLSGSEHGLKLVMDRLKDESWDTQQQSLQCMLLGAKKIPCRLDDVDDVRGPFQQGYHSPPNPKHMAMDKAVRGHGANSDDDFEPYDEAAARRLKNGYEASTHQSEIIPRQLLPHWEPPDNHGKAPHEQTHEWTRGWRFTLEATGLEGAHYTELSGRHYKETARSAYLKLKAAGGYASLGSGTRSKTANAPSKHKTHSLAEDHDEEWLDTAATGATMDDDFETSEEQQARANKAAGKGDSKFGSRDPRLGKKGGVANQSADSKLQVCVCVCVIEPLNPRPHNGGLHRIVRAATVWPRACMQPGHLHHLNVLGVQEQPTRLARKPQHVR